MKSFGEDDSYEAIRRRVVRNGASLLKSIVNWHMDGSLEHPEKSAVFVAILDNICKGRMETLCDEDGVVSFKLTPEYEQYLQEMEALFTEDITGGFENVIKGPWQ